MSFRFIFVVLIMNGITICVFQIHTYITLCKVKGYFSNFLTKPNDQRELVYFCMAKKSEKISNLLGARYV